MIIIFFILFLFYKESLIFNIKNLAQEITELSQTVNEANSMIE
jgi:hypothetical protein